MSTTRGSRGATAAGGAPSSPCALTNVQLVAVATDRSEGGDFALEWAADLTRSLGAELVAIQVLPPPHGEGAPDTGRLRTELEEALATHGLNAQAVVATGDDVAATIVEAAHGAGAGVIVVGSSGMQGRKEFLLGNVANRVTHLSRCTVIVVNTTPDSSVEEEQRADTLRNRTQEIGRVLGPLGVRQLSGRVLRSSGQTDGPRRLREALEELGPTFGKLGQILSTRPDLLSEEYLAELSSLQANVPPLAEAEVVGMMERELGVPWEDVFSAIETEPLAAGTIGQVHRARLADGHRVVVKVQRPSAERVVEQDLALLQAAIRPVARSRRMRRVVDLPSLVDQVSAALRAELDFREEARNLERMGTIVARCRRVAVPRCHQDLSTKGLLVMDEIVDGVPLSEAPAGPELTEATRELLQVYYRQVLDEGFFHADPHPGNLMWAEGAIWLLDLGMVGRIDASTRRNLMLVLLAFAQGDVELLMDLTLDLSESEGDAELDFAAFRSDLASLIEGVRGRSLQEIQLIQLLNQLTAISIRHGVPLPSSIAMVAKALTQVELTVSELAPELDPIEEAGRYFVRSLSRRVVGRFDPKQLVYEAERMRYRMGQIGEGLATVAGNRPGRQFEVKFTSHRLEHKVMRAGRIVGLGAGAGLTWVAAAVASGSDRADPRLARGLRGLAGGLSAGLIAEVVRRR